MAAGLRTYSISGRINSLYRPMQCLYFFVSLRQGDANDISFFNCKAVLLFFFDQVSVDENTSNTVRTAVDQSKGRIIYCHRCVKLPN